MKPSTVEIAEHFVVDTNKLLIYHMPGYNERFSWIEFYGWIQDMMDEPRFHDLPIPLVIHHDGPVMVNGWRMTREAEAHLVLWKLRPLRYEI